MPGVAGRSAAAHNRLEEELTALLRHTLKAVPRESVAAGYVRWFDAAQELLSPGGDLADSGWERWTAYRKEVADARGSLAQIDLAQSDVVRVARDTLRERTGNVGDVSRGSLDLVEGVYTENPVADRFNRRLAAWVTAAVGRKLEANPASKIRILEIGAGTGATSSRVLEGLATWRESVDEYCFTDVSRAFLLRAERNFGATYPFLRTAFLDVEEPAAGQGFAEGTYDLVIAANVLHATRRIRTTLGHVHDLLAADGVLLLNETARPTLFTHATFGLLEGWWRFEDGELRLPGSPSLAPESWRTVLDEMGFAMVRATGADEHALGQQVIAAAAGVRSFAAASVKPMPRREEVRPSPAQRAKKEVEAQQPAVPTAGPTVQTAILQALADTLNLKTSAIDIDMPFATFGLDSILGGELVGTLRRTLGVAVPVTELYDRSTVRKLASWVASEFPQAGATIGSPSRESVPAQIPEATLRRAPAQSSSAAKEPIAIIGMSGRFAQSPDLAALWSHLASGDNLVTKASRWDLDKVFADAEAGSFCRHGSFLDGIDEFDATFFGISGVEATYMDPQQRIFLEEAWKALEDAGHAGQEMKGRRCGIYVGCSSGDYQELFRAQPPGQAFWGNTSSLVPARLSYYLDLKGPALAVDTACSSSLVAVHLACQSLWSGESEMALAGGVFVQCTPRFFRYANQARMLSLSGCCAPFGDGADGIVPGEAAGAVVLRPLSAALADGDAILGVILGTGINQDGTTNGITAPSSVSQESLIRSVCEQTGVDPRRIGMVEAHGTGTVLGDPIEHAALTRAFAGTATERGFCALGSIKGNLGHATTAAGIAGLLRVLLAFQHEAIPPALHFGGGNPAIDMDPSPFYVNENPKRWPATPRGDRLAAVSSFGFSGTNAHAILREAPPVAAPATLPAYLVVLSARSESQLRQVVERLTGRLQAEPDLSCAAVSFTLLAGRRHCEDRLATVVRDSAELLERLLGWLEGRLQQEVRFAELKEISRAEPTPSGKLKLEELARRGAETDVRRYRELLDQVAQHFLAGDPLSYASLFGERRTQRVSLPGYPFARDRFWVEEASSPVAKAAAQPSSAVLGASSRVRLVDPQSLGNLRMAMPTASRGVVLGDVAKARLLRKADGDGVLRLECSGKWGAELDRQLADALASASTDETVRCVVVVFGEDVSSEAASDASLQAALDCSVPVVAAMRGGVRGVAWLAGMYADFATLAEHVRYGSYVASQRKEGLEALLTRRFGRDAVDSLLGTKEGCSGSELLRGGCGCRVLPAAQVESAALELAREIAQAPRVALIELKRNVRSLTALVPMPERVPFLPFPGGRCGGRRGCKISASAIQGGRDRGIFGWRGACADAGCRGEEYVHARTDAGAAGSLRCHSSDARVQGGCAYRLRAILRLWRNT